MPTPPLIPHCSPPVWRPDIPSALLASRFKLAGRDAPGDAQVALIGLPDDLGVRLNNGRPGAREGPRAFREALSRYGVAEPQGFVWPDVFDAGDIIPAQGSDAAALAETHRRITEAVRALLDLNLFPIAIGGGHDLTLPFVRAVAERIAPDTLAGVYFDAHLDVRDTVGSGMPFRRLIQDHGVEPLLVIGFNPLVNARQHVTWFIENGGEIADDDWAGPLADDAAGTDISPPLLEPLDGSNHIFCSFDLDCLDASQAPGVSALNPDGIRVRDAARALFVIASDPRLACLDFMELSPPHDVDGRTARIAAHLFLHALVGLRMGPLLHREQP